MAENELPSVALTKRFLTLCEQHGAQQIVVRMVAIARNRGIAGLPRDDDWTKWNAQETRAAVEYREQADRR